MNYKEIIENIKKNEIKNIYLFYGEEIYLISDALKKLKEKLIDCNFEQFNFIVIEGRDASYEKIIDACETLPFMAEKKLVYINELDVFQGKSKSFSETEENQFIKYIADFPKNTTIVFYGNSSLDGRKKIVKQIKKHGTLVEFTKLKENEFNAWIKSTLKKMGKSIAANELALLKNNFDYLGRNPSQSLLDVENEIKKLVAFMGEEIDLQKEHIDKVLGSSFHNDIFNLIDSIEKRNFAESVKRLNCILDSGEPVLKILTTLGNQIKNILSSKLLFERGYTSKMIATELGIHPFVASKCTEQSKQFSVDQLKELLNLFLEADIMIKLGTMDENMVVEMLIFKICKQEN